MPNCGGVLCPPEWAQPATIFELAEAAETEGFDSVWLHDHLVTPSELAHLGSPAFYEPLITMAVLAGRVPRISVGVATVVLPLRDPVVLAKQIGTLNGFHPGRLIFGLGAGRYESEYAAVGQGDRFKQRGKVSEEWLQIIRELRDSPAGSFDGQFRSISDASMHPQFTGSERAPLWYAGNSKTAALRAAQYADGWIGASISADEVEVLISQIKAARAADEQLAAPFDLAISATIENAASVNLDQSHLHTHSTAITGDASSVAQALGEFVRLGVGHFLLSLRASSPEDLQSQMHWFATEVMPQVRRPQDEERLVVKTG